MNRRPSLWLMLAALQLIIGAWQVNGASSGLEPPPVETPPSPMPEREPAAGQVEAAVMPPSLPWANPDVAAFPYFEDFESGFLDSEWHEFITAQGRVRLSADHPYAGNYGLLLDDHTSDATFSTAAAILTIDLSGQAEVELSFYWREFSDENHAADGVFISEDDGANWQQAFSFNNGPNSWTAANVDIAAAAAANSLALNDHFQIKFQFYDNYGIGENEAISDGYAIDDIRLQKPPRRLFLAIISKDASPAIMPPLLNPVDNPTGDFDYTVSWNAAAWATEYLSQEDDNAAFSSPVDVYRGSATATAIRGQALGTYYYRVKGLNAAGESGWSNTQSTTVTVVRPPCPQAGPWQGTTDQGRAISFTMQQTPSCRLSGLKISYRVTCDMGSAWTTTTTFITTQSVVDHQFDSGGLTPQVAGSFNSTDQSSGTWLYSGANPVNPIESCNSNGTWSASP